METIITDIARTLKDSDSLLEAELELETLFQDMIEQLMEKAIQQVDLELIHQYKAQGYEIDSCPKRTVQFTFGSITFHRRRLRKKGEPSIVPLDQAVDLESGVHHSPLVKMKATQMASDGAYRKAEKAIDLLTPFSLSHTTIHTMTQEVGETIQTWIDEVPHVRETPQKEKKKVPVLFIEGDGLLLTKRNEEKRPELHRVQFHEGVEYKGKQNRPVLKNSYLFESSISSQEAFQRASRWLAMMYDIRQTIVISNSDGGSGYEKEKFDQIIGSCARHEHFRDRYHVNEKIKQRMYFDRTMEKKMRRAVRQYDQALIHTVLTTTESRIDPEDEKAPEFKEELRKLDAYIHRNWSSLQPLHRRDLPVQKGLGSCESNHRPYSYRMKHQGRGFTTKGAGNVAAIISARKNGTFLQALTETLPELTHSLSWDFKKAVKAALKKPKTRPSMGVRQGKIANYSSSSSPIGRLEKMFR